MTDQLEDDFIFQGEKFTLAACSADDPFSPYKQLGIRTNMVSTACWRGHHNTYGFVEDHLVVAELRLCLYEDEVDYLRLPGPVINGVEPSEQESEPDDFNNNYLGLDYPLEYSGGLIIGKEYILKHHMDLDWISFWKYGRVVELRFDAGQLTEVRDLSEMMRPIQEFAEEQSQLRAKFMDETSAEMSKASSEQEKEAAKQRFREKVRGSILDKSTDDFAREQLEGKVDPVYLRPDKTG